MGKITAGAQALEHTLASRPSGYLTLSFFRTETCQGRVGRGFINIANGPDDFEKMECGGVWGRARRRYQLTYDFPLHLSPPPF
jgi:hypothetical protein